MAAIPLPTVDYAPKIPQEVVKGYKTEDGNRVGISDVQLEAVSLAGKAHEEILPNGERRGFMVGDGTGVGKAREIAGIILDNFNRGRKRAVWVTKNSKLFTPNKLEWTRVGGDADLVFEHNKVASGAPVRSDKGILFTTYSTLGQVASDQAKAAGNVLSRVDQIVDWLGADFDGVLVFDEAHEMGSAVERGSGLGKRKAAAKALAGVDLQAKLPKARVVYFSATSATEVENLAYADRLGLWGDGTPFANKHKFIDRIAKGGVAAMEKVAADMKALGMYIARNIAFNDGTEKGTVKYERLEHVLNEDQERVYSKLAEAWRKVFANMAEALKLTGVVGTNSSGEDVTKNSRALAAARGQFWSANQRFWNQVVTAMQTPTALAQMERSLAAGNSVVVQLTNTNEAAQKRALEGKDADADLDDVDVSPRYILMDYIERSFPTTAYEEYLDDDGNARTRPVVDSQGNPVQDVEAVKLKEQLLSELGSLQVADRGALDMIIDRFGEEMVAEVTGRSERLVEKDGKKVRQKRGERAGRADIDAFMDGKKRILIFSEAGGTGASYHADLTRKNQQKRDHILLQPGWRADAAVQGLGRTHRSNQSQAPTYFLVHTNLKGQKRFISTIARRLGQLGALTKGQRSAGDQGIFQAADNLESTEARAALHKLYGDIVNNRIPSLGMSYVNDALGLQLTDKDGNIKAELPPITQFMNRILSLPVAEQNAVFDEFQQRLDEEVAGAIRAGTLDQGMETVRADKIHETSRQTVFTHPTGAETTYHTIKLSRKTKPRSFEKVIDKIGAEPWGYVRSAVTGKVAVVEGLNTSIQDDDGHLSRKLKLHYPLAEDFTTEKKLEGKNWTKVSEKEAKADWARQLESVPDYHDETMHILSGVLLPIWDRMPDKSAQVKRLTTDDGKQILGRVIPGDEIRDVLGRLGVKADSSAPTLTPQEAADAVLAGSVLVLGNGWKIKRSKIQDETTIEIVGPDYSHSGEIQRIGGFTRRVGMKTRVFLPMGDKLVDAIGKLAATRTIVDVLKGRAGEDSNTSAYVPPGQSPNQQQGAAKPAGKASPAHHIIQAWERIFGVPLRAGFIRERKAAGIYQWLQDTIRLRESYITDLATAAHEIGHHLDKMTNAVKGRKSMVRGAQPIVRQQLSQLDYDQSQGRMFEGWAEFLRKYITEKNTTPPELTHWFENVWAAAHPSEWQKVKQAQTHARNHFDQSIFDRVAQAIGTPTSDVEWRGRWQTFVDSWNEAGIAHWYDDITPLAKADEFADEMKQPGISAYRTMMVLRHSEIAAAARALQDGVFDIVTGQTLGKGLWPRILENTRNFGEAKEAQVYAYAKHTLYMAKRRRSYNAGFGGGSAADGQKLAQQFVDSLPQEKRDRYDNVAKAINDYSRELRLMEVRAGRLPKADYLRMVRFYGDNFFPLERVQDRRGLRGGVKRIFNLPRAAMGRSKEGSGRPIEDVFVQLQARTIRAYSGAHSARVARALIERLDPTVDGPSGKGAQNAGFLLTPIPPTTKVTKGKVDDIIRTLVDNGWVEADVAKASRIVGVLSGTLDYSIEPDDIDWLADYLGLPAGTDAADLIQKADEEGVPDLLDTFLLYRQDYSPIPDKNIVQYVDADGVRRRYELDPRLHEAIARMTPQAMNVFIRMAKAMGSLFNLGAIALSTGFGVRNLWRDPQIYAAQSKYYSPPEALAAVAKMAAKYALYRTAKKFGKAQPNAFFDLFEEKGGNIASLLKQSRKSQMRHARRSLVHGPGERLIVGLKHPIESFKLTIDNMVDLMSFTDAPPRLAEFEASIRAAGFEQVSGGWRDTQTGQIVKYLPERVVIDGMYDALEATLNHKRSGDYARVVNAILPLTAANIRAAGRRGRNVKTLGMAAAGKASPEVEKQAINFAMVSLAAIAVGFTYAMARKDDDDYIEGEGYLNYNNFTWGSGGTTWLRVPKDYSVAPFYAFGEWLGGGNMTWQELVDQEIANDLPLGGGWARSLLEVAMNKDMFRDRKIETNESAPPERRANAYTSRFAKALGDWTGRHVGISPQQIDHFLGGATGGMYRRHVEAWDAAHDGRLGPQHLPFIRGFYLGQHSAKSLNALYNEIDAASTEYHRARYDAEDAAAAKRPDAAALVKNAKAAGRRSRRLNSYMRIIERIIDVEQQKRLGGRRTYEFQPYLVGLSREALGLPPLKSSPNPFDANDLPPAIRGVIYEETEKHAKRAILSLGRPQKESGEGPTLEARRADWDARYEESAEWLRLHANSDIVKQALADVKKSKGYASLFTPPKTRPRTAPRPGETRDQWQDYLDGQKWESERRRRASRFMASIGVAAD